MRIHFDPHKDQLNLRNHGISLRAAEQLEWDSFISMEDQRFDYGEQRMIGFGYIGLTFYCLVYVEYDDEHWRAISLRRATRQEIQAYANA